MRLDFEGESHLSNLQVASVTEWYVIRQLKLCICSVAIMHTLCGSVTSAL